MINISSLLKFWYW